MIANNTTASTAKLGDGTGDIEFIPKEYMRATDETPKPVRRKLTPIRRQYPKVGRNQPCPCGSGKKFKHCHGGI